MESIVSKIYEYDDLASLGGVSPEDIEVVEKKLALQFSDEYRQILLEFGVVSFNGHEINGISNAIRLDVVINTKEEKERTDDIPADFYLIEDTHIDGILIWQDSDGFIYETGPNQKPRQVFDSLGEYLGLKN
jgi:hypothetical protein